jgi:hypothetical protein
MFGNLFGNKEEKDHLFRHVVFMTAEAKKIALLKLAKEDESSVFIAWFPETARTIGNYFNENGVDKNRVIEAKDSTSARLAAHTPVFLEHYPIHEKEKQLVEHWNLINIPVYSSMDEPLFKHLGAEKMIPMMKMLGMKETEAIQHSMVSKSIVKGQESIAEKAGLDRSASSQQEWMNKNLLSGTH